MHSKQYDPKSITQVSYFNDIVGLYGSRSLIPAFDSIFTEALGLVPLEI
jgi:hypothetical protein